MVFHLSLSEIKFSQVSRIFPSILVDLNNAVVLTVHLSSDFMSSNHFNSAPITYVFNVTFIFNALFLVLLQGLRTYLSFRVVSFLLCGLPGRQSLLFGRYSPLFFVTFKMSILLAGIKWSVCISFIIIIIIITAWIIHTSIRWRSFTRVKLTVNRLWSSGLLSVFLPILPLQKSGWSLSFSFFPIPPFFFFNPSEDVESVHTTIGITVTIRLRSFFSSLVMSKYF